MQLSLASILPDLAALFTDPGSSEGISALFWAVEVVIFVVFCIYLVTKAKCSFSNVDELLKMLSTLSPADMIAQRRTLRRHKFKNKEINILWRELDETLVVNSHAERLYSTYDAAHFFNTHSLASKVAESRLLAAVPGFLTAVGVIGTFLGLQLGLGALNLNTSDTEQLKDAIAALISSASIAFMTSVWGVFLSLLFNAFEKIVEGEIRNKIALLQQCIDELFPRLIAEQTLLDISRDGHQSKETLMGLAEQIGNRMQTAVQGMAEEFTSGMTVSLERIMAPAIEQMVGASMELAGKQANSSEDALKSLVDKFMDGMGQAGAQQKSLMQQASSDMNRSMAEWSQGLTQFMEQLNLTISRLETMSEQQGKALTDQINQSLGSQKESTEYATGQMKKVAENLMESVKDHHRQVAATEQLRLEHLTQHMKNSAQSQAEEMQKISDSSHAAAEEFQFTMKQSMEVLMADYQSRQEAIADGDAQRQQMMDTKIAQLTGSVNAQFVQLMDQFAMLQRSGAEADVERQNALDSKIAELTEMVNGSFGTLLQQLNDQQQGAASADLERQNKLTSVLENFIKHQNEGFGQTLKQAEAVNDQFTRTVQERINGLITQDKQRDLEIRSQMESMQAQMTHIVEDMRTAMDGHIQSVKTVLQQAQVLNDGILRNQTGLNNAAEHITTASSQMEQVSENLHRSYQEVARATDGISGTLSMTASAITESSHQNTEVAEGLKNTLAGLENLQTALQVVSDDIRIGGENADSASRELATNHARYRQEMEGAIGTLHKQLGDLLHAYAKQVQDQTAHRMEEWNRHTQEYVNGMTSVVSVMQELVDDMDNRQRAA